MAIDTEERKAGTPVTETGAPGAAKKNNKKTLIIILSVVGGLVLLGIISSVVAGFMFKKGAESFISIVSDGKVKLDTSKDGGSATYKDKDGDISINSGSKTKLPAAYPESDVPLYKGAELIMASDLTIDGVKTFSINQTTKDSTEKVVQFYKNAFSGADWKQGYDTNRDTTHSSQFSNDAKNLSVILYVAPDDSATAISITVREGKKE